MIKRGMNELALFAGAGGGILGGYLLGWRTVCAVERDAYAAQVLAQRQNDGTLAPFPIWSDVCSFDGRPWRGVVDVVSGGFPCQDISPAGKGAGIDGDRSGLWRHMARIVGEVRPRFVFVENSPALVGRGIARVIGDLSTMGYDARWGVVGAWHAGAPHIRERAWIVAHDTLPDTEGKRSRAQRAQVAIAQWPEGIGGGGELLPDADGERLEEQRGTEPEAKRLAKPEQCGWWEVEPALGRVVDGMAYRVEQLRALGNGQVPAVAQFAWKLLTQ
jgi:DNA (cytosine-5)-methyltransferase 1